MVGLVKAEDAEPEIPDDDELDKYSEGVQKRIQENDL